MFYTCTFKSRKNRDINFQESPLPSTFGGSLNIGESQDLIWAFKCSITWTSSLLTSSLIVAPELLWKSPTRKEKAKKKGNTWHVIKLGNTWHVLPDFVCFLLYSDLRSTKLLKRVWSEEDLAREDMEQTFVFFSMNADASLTWVREKGWFDELNTT